MPGPQAGWDAIDRREFKLVNHGRNVYYSPHTKCASGANCTGPGCRISTGKTRRIVVWQST